MSMRPRTLSHSSSPSRSRAYPPPNSALKPTLHRLFLSPRNLLLPSVRLKSALYLLSLLILALIFLALNAANLSSNRVSLTDGSLNAVRAEEGLASEGTTTVQGKDAVEKEEEIERSFEEPDYALLSSRQPSEIGCNVPLAGEGPEEDEGKLVFLGIFSTADKKDRRDLYRKVILPDYPSSLFTVKFILGLPPFPAKPISQEALERTKFLRRLQAENQEHGDMVILPVVDNIDLGKTHAYLQWIAKEFEGEGRVKGRPRFVMKADDDTILVMPNVVSAFKNLDCSENVYWGTSAGSSHYFGNYFRGLAYAMSWPLVSWIGSAQMPTAHIVKIEDARTGQWLRHLDPVTDPIRRIDMGWTMGDWNQLDVTTETVALHWLKWDEWVIEQHDRLLSIWAAADRPYTAEHGVDPRLSVIKGKMTPEEAEKEHQRQKELGWDVAGNLLNDEK